MRAQIKFHKWTRQKITAGRIYFPDRPAHRPRPVTRNFTACVDEISLLQPASETVEKSFQKNADLISSACSSIDQFQSTRPAGEVLLAFGEALARPIYCGVVGPGHKMQAVKRRFNECEQHN